MRRTLLFVICFLAGWFTAMANTGGERGMIRKGNKHYGEGSFPEAELEYRRALEENPMDPRALFNLGNALYRQGRFDEASAVFDALAGMAPDGIDLADTYHNLGNAHLGAQRFGDGVEAYKNALRIRPEDNDTRYNLEYALRFLQDPPPADQQPQEQQGDQPDEGQPDQEGEQDPQEGQDPGETQRPESRESPGEESQPGQPDRISPQDAERILDALNQQEQKVQENVNREKEPVQPRRTGREW